MGVFNFSGTSQASFPSEKNAFMGKQPIPQQPQGWIPALGDGNAPLSSPVLPHMESSLGGPVIPMGNICG